MRSYAKAAEAIAFMQQLPKVPGTLDKPYTGSGGESCGIAVLLEVIESDLVRLKSETCAAEATARGDYDTFSTDAKVEKEVKPTSIEHMSAKRQDQILALTLKKDDLTEHSFEQKQNIFNLPRVAG